MCSGSEEGSYLRLIDKEGSYLRLIDFGITTARAEVEAAATARVGALEKKLAATEKRAAQVQTPLARGRST